MRTLKATVGLLTGVGAFLIALGFWNPTFAQNQMPPKATHKVTIGNTAYPCLCQLPYSHPPTQSMRPVFPPPPKPISQNAPVPNLKRQQKNDQAYQYYKPHYSKPYRPKVRVYPKFNFGYGYPNGNYGGFYYGLGLGLSLPGFSLQFNGL